jgi:hypothetical protein
MKLKLDIDGETYDKLIEVACRERRPPDWHAEVLLRQALGLPFPYPPMRRDEHSEANGHGAAAGAGEEVSREA